MSVDRRIIPIRPRRSGQRAPPKPIFNLPLILSTNTPEDEDIRLSFDHAGNWSQASVRKVREKPFENSPERKFVSVGIQHDGFELSHSRISANVGCTDGSTAVGDLFEGQGHYEFDFKAEMKEPVKSSYQHAETQTDVLPGVTLPQWTYSKRRVRFVNRSRRKYMKEKRKVKVAEKEEKWICPFCDYEDIYNEPPRALISAYEENEKKQFQLQTKKTGASAMPLFSTFMMFPDSYYEWESQPPDRSYISHGYDYGG